MQIKTTLRCHFSPARLGKKPIQLFNTLPWQSYGEAQTDTVHGNAKRCHPHEAPQLPFDSLTPGIPDTPAHIQNGIQVRKILALGPLFEIGNIFKLPKVQQWGTGWENVLYPCSGAIKNMKLFLKRGGR